MIAALVVAKITGNAYNAVYAILLSFALIALILGTESLKSPPPTWFRKFSYGISCYSYSLFLSHYSLYYMLFELTQGWSPAIRFLTMFITANAIAYALYFVTEKRTHYVRNFLYRLFRIEPQLTR